MLEHHLQRQLQHKSDKKENVVVYIPMKTDEIETVVEVCAVAWKGGHNIAVVVKDCGLSELESVLTSAWYLCGGKIKIPKKSTLSQNLMLCMLAKVRSFYVPSKNLCL